MNWRLPKLFLSFVIGLLPVAPGIIAQQAPVGLERRKFQVWPEFLIDYSRAAQADPFATSPEPTADAPKRGVRVLSARQMLESQGVSFPKGAGAMFHAEGNTLIVCNTPANLELVERVVKSVCVASPVSFRVIVHVIEAPTARLRMTDRDKLSPDVNSELARLLEEGDRRDSDVGILHTAFGEGRSGRRFEVSCEAVNTYAAVNEDHGAVVEDRVHEVGFELKIEPYLQADGYSIQMKLVADIARPSSEGLTKSAQLPRIRTQKIETEVTVTNGQSALVGSWSVEGKEGVSQAVIITAHREVHHLMGRSTVPLAKLPDDPSTMMEHTFVLPLQMLWAPNGAKAEKLTDLPLLRDIHLAPGSEVSMNGQGHLLIRTTAEAMTEVDASIQHLLGSHKKTLSFTVDTFRGPAAMIRSIARDCAIESDHSGALRVLEDAITTGHASRVAFSYMQTKSGQGVTNHSHLDRHCVSALRWQKQQRPEYDCVHEAAGFLVRIDPIVLGDGQTVEVETSLIRHFDRPKPWGERISDSSTGRNFEMPRDEFHQVRLESTSTVRDGHVRLLGVWRPVTQAGIGSDDVLEAAFITCHVTHLAPSLEDPQNTFVEPALDGEGDAAGEMQTRSFRIHPSVRFRTGNSGHAEGGNSEDYLKECGIPFPKGARVVTLGAVANHLVVTNTEANLAKIQTVVDKLNERFKEAGTFTLHLLEIPSGLARETILKNAPNPDHAGALNSLLELANTSAVRQLTTLNLTAGNGIEASITEGQAYLFLQGVEVDDDGTAHPKHETVTVGTTLKIESSVADDGMSFDLRCHLTHHTAPPESRVQNLSPLVAPPIEVNLTDFYVESYEGNLSMAPGTTRILAVWKPWDRAELEKRDVLHIAFLEARRLKRK